MSDSFLRFIFLGWLDDFRDGDKAMGFASLLLSTLCTLVIALISIMVFVFTYDAIDTSGDLSRTRATIVDTRYSAPYTSMVMSGKVLVPIHHPASWHATFAVPGGEDELGISHEIYNHLEAGDQTDVMVTEGVLSHQVRVVSLAH